MFLQETETMKLDFNIQVNQRQGLTLTAQVQQAIKLLHMTNQEIQEFVQDEFQDNPFVETELFSEKNQINENRKNDSQELDNSFKETPHKAQESQTRASIENQFETGDVYIPKSTVAKAETDFDTIGTITEKPKSLYSHCIEYIDNLQLHGIQRLIAMRLVEELEPTGWISSELKTVSSSLRCELRQVENVLLELQQMEPAGLFARNLRECLILQAVDTNKYCESLAVILDNLHLIEKGKFDLLKRRCGCSDTEISSLFKIIKSFNPKPGLQFEQVDVPIREPDLQVHETDDGWLVELNNSTLPNIKIEKEYAKELRNKVVQKDDREFIQTKVSEAKWLSKAIEKRNETMLKVGTAIVERQKKFLQKGAQFIEPMVLRDIADAVEMHESTISRVTTGSLIQTPQGTVELKAFFSVGLQQDNDIGSTSSASIKYKIKKLIEAENPTGPISDDSIVEKLSSQGINLARRTVAKYRKMENIPSSFARKRRNVISGAV